MTVPHMIIYFLYYNDNGIYHLLKYFYAKEEAK
jgi:hypothetical protein